jgi:Membrane dipeptidase (Peptidase family M19)
VRPGKLGLERYFEIQADDCAANHEAPGECVMYHLDPFPQLRLVIARPIFTLFRRAPGFVVVTADCFNTGQLGQKNLYGLTPKGREYIRALRRHGMIVDTAHMSDKSVNDTYAVLEERPGYPAVISHAHFRKEGLYDPNQEIADYLASEYDISDSNLEKVKNAGGVVGAFMHQPRINPDSMDVEIKKKIFNDCGNSSKGFAFAFHYAQQQVPGGVGMATDMTFIPLVSPRFGEHPCEGYKPFRQGKIEHANHSERYRPHEQKDPVWYDGIPLIQKTNQHAPLKTIPHG